MAAIQDSASFRRYLDVQAHFHAYFSNNVLLILAQRPSATRVASYQTWLTLERQVVRGETGIQILYPWYNASKGFRRDGRRTHDNRRQVGEAAREVHSR